MPKEFSRADRIADAVQRHLAQFIRSEIRDPRLGMVNINAVDVSRDLAMAKVYVTLVGETDAKACKTSIEILNKTANFLRSLISKELTMRSAPKLQFVFDESSGRASALDSLISEALAADNKNRNSRGE